MLKSTHPRRGQRKSIIEKRVWINWPRTDRNVYLIRRLSVLMGFPVFVLEKASIGVILFHLFVYKLRCPCPQHAPVNPYIDIIALDRWT